MIIVKLAGGLGNQMFQYALGRRLALARGSSVALDISHYPHQALRDYRLGHFNICEQIAAPQETARLTGGSDHSRLRRFLRFWEKARPYYQRAVVFERYPFHYDPHMLEVPANAYLRGYWQNEKYFSAIADTLRTEFTLRHALSPSRAELQRRIEAAESVGVHVRRGDYAAQAETKRVHGLCGVEYYQACADQLISAHPHAIFYIFSDDPQWARENLKLGASCVIVEHAEPDRDYEDLYILSRCQHFILANSTFGWWAAWLSAYGEKTVFAPKQWLAIDRYDSADIIPAAWNRL